jgi:hypothetical protein
LRISSAAILILFMIRRGFLDPESRKDLIELARDGRLRTVWGAGPTPSCFWMTA